MLKHARGVKMSDIMSISRLRMGTDGKGVTTLVGFHGCPLFCKYCANDHCHRTDMKRADYTPEELISVLSIDEPYFMMTGGGVTFGGGEPLVQAEFIHEVCLKMKKAWRRTIETSLYAPWKDVELLVHDIDYWYIDIKDIDNEIYKSYTGKSNEGVIDNLKKLLKIVSPDKICIRMPLIPGYNTEDSRRQGIDFIANEISSKVSLDLFRYIR